MRWERKRRLGMRAAGLVAAVAAAIAPSGCESDLSDLIDDLRAAAPNVCKDYCEDKLACEWPASSGTEEEMAFSEAVQRCTVDCAFYVGKGAYAARDGEKPDEIDFFAGVSGDTVRGTLECAMEGGTFRCTGGEPTDSHVFGGVVQSVCEDADACLEQLGIDQHVDWTQTAPDAGVCAETGSEWIDAEFFEP